MDKQVIHVCSYMALDGVHLIHHASRAPQSTSYVTTSLCVCNSQVCVCVHVLHMFLVCRGVCVSVYWEVAINPLLNWLVE